MRFYLGGIGFRGGKPRIYGGLAQRLGPAAIGVSRNGTPWVKVSARRLLSTRGPTHYTAPHLSAFDWRMVALFVATCAGLALLLYLLPR